MCTRPFQQVVDEIEEAGVGPLQILEDEDGGAAVGDALEERPPGGEQLLALSGRCLVEAEEGRQARLHPAPVGGIRDVLRDRRLELRPCRGRIVRFGDSGAAADHLAECPVADPLAVCERASLVPVDVLDEPVDVLEEFPREAALADPGLAHDRDEPGAALP